MHNHRNIPQNCTLQPDPSTSDKVMDYINEDGKRKYFLNKSSFKVNDVEFQIVESRIVKGIPDCNDVIHRIKNHKTGECSDLPMKRLIEIFYENHLIE